MHSATAYAQMRCEQIRAQCYPGGPGKYAGDKIAFYSSPEGKRFVRFLLIGNLTLLAAFVLTLAISSR